MNATRDEQMIRVCSGNPDAWLKRYRGKKPGFVCVLSYTQTGNIPGISAAGNTPQARQYTALADGEYLLAPDPSASAHLPSAHLPSARSTSGPLALKQPRYALPPLRAGISPALISRAIITRQQIPCCLMSTGLPGRLSVPYVALPEVRAQSLETGCAMTVEQINQLWASGLHWGKQLARLFAGRYLILGECVVGGTTTAQALLSALGYEVSGYMSSSHAIGNHSQKQALVERGLAIWRRGRHLSALTAMAAVGDPMQVVVAAIALAASRKIGVLLAGGSQMLAVYALIKTIRAKAAGLPVSEQILVGTTRWVIEDKSADTVLIAQSVGAPYVASEINFSQSTYAQLKAYEQGFVKEGVGAGGCAIAASLQSGWGPSQIRQAVEAELESSSIGGRYWNRPLLEPAG